MGKLDAIDCSKDVSLTQQSGAEECDINFIVERAKRGAALDVNPKPPMYGDFTSLPTDLRDCLAIVKKADEAFMTLDAQVRKRFENDPSQMMDFLKDPKNRDEAIKLGLVKAPVVPPVDESLETLRSIDSSLKANSGLKKSRAKPDDE